MKYEDMLTVGGFTPDFLNFFKHGMKGALNGNPIKDYFDNGDIGDLLESLLDILNAAERESTKLKKDQS